MSILDPTLAAVYKEWYTDKSPYDTYFRNSPLVKTIPTSRIGGKTYNVFLDMGNGGNASGSLRASTDNMIANGNAPSAPFAISSGQMFATFQIAQADILASRTVRGAFVPAPVLLLHKSLDSFRKLMAISLYGSGFGEIGHPVVITTVVGANTMTLTDQTTANSLAVGQVFRVTNGALPSSSVRTSKNTVTHVNGLSITFTSDTIETWAVTDWIELDGCRNGSTPLLPVGLSAWLPTVGNRVPGSAWDAYIAAPFFGVDRSINAASAGQFILRDVGGSEKYTDAVTRGVNAVRTAGGLPDLLVINPQIYFKIVQELNAQTNLWQAINMTASNNNPNEVVRGISQLKFAFSSTWVDQTFDDPWCPTFTGYILQKDVLELAALTNVETPLNDGISGNDPGKQPIDQTSAPDLNYYWLIEDYLTSMPGPIVQNGAQLQVAVQFYGCWVNHAPSNCAVINFV